MKTLLPVLLICILAACSAAKKNILGYWYKPKTQVSVRFYPDKTFEYSDYDSTANKTEIFTGKYKLNGSNVILEFVDKTTETLMFERLATGNKTYHLKRGNDFLMKDARVNNSVPPPIN